MDAREKFLSAGLATVQLPSGAVVRGRLPTTEDLYVRDMVPQDLLAVVMKFAHGANLKDIPEPERPLWYRYLRLLVAAFLQFVQDDEGQWQPIRLLTVQDVDAMDPRDIDELEYLVLRLKTADQVTAASKVLAGEISIEEASETIKAEAPKTFGGWATFRRFVTSDGRGNDGTGVRPEAEPDAQPNRSARRARPRRGTRVPATG